MIADQLSKAWNEHRKLTSVDPVMRFSDEGLVLGSGTVLAPASPSGPEFAIDLSDPRLAALLTAAHLARPSASALAHLRKAADRWGEGDKALAAMHLVLSRVDR